MIKYSMCSYMFSKHVCRFTKKFPGAIGHLNTAEQKYGNKEYRNKIKIGNTEKIIYRKIQD